MEAAPKLAMLSLDLKESPSPADFRTPFRQYIQRHYGETASAYEKELGELDSLRNNAIKASRDIMGCNQLKRYLCQLKMLYPRFPMQEDEAAAVEFVWIDNFTSKPTKTRDPKFEEANILYNIGALHSLLGALDRRTNSETMQAACTHFRCAAWAFQHLCEKYPQLETFDLSLSVLSFYSTLMLAQVQECILEKSLLDNRKSSIISKVAAQVVEYFKDCLKILDVKPVVRIPEMDIFKESIPRQLLELKIAYYQCIAYYQMGCQAEEAQKIGEKISYLEAAAKELTLCNKLVKNCGDDENCRDAVQFVGDIVQQKLAAAKKDNDFIYHEKVPDVKTLPETKGVSLAKGIPVNDSDFVDQDIFVRLIPMSAHERSSLYSEKKTVLLRDLAGRTETKDIELESLVSGLRIEQLKIPNNPKVLPQEFLNMLAVLQAEGDVTSNIDRHEATLSDASEEVQRISQETSVLLETLKSVKLDKNLTTAVDQLVDDYTPYARALSAGVKSSEDLLRFIKEHTDDLVLLSRPVKEVEARIPHVDLTKIQDPVADLNQLQVMEKKVEEMKIQRKEFIVQLRTSLQNDDVTRKVLAANPDNLESFFQDELKKHAPIVDVLEKNMAAQENITSALTAVVERLANLRALLVETKLRRNEAMERYHNAFKAYLTLDEKVAEGLTFYRNLKENLLKVKQKAEEIFKQTPLAVVKPKMTRPPEAPRDEFSPAGPVSNGPTLRDYMNRAKGLPESAPPSSYDPVPPLVNSGPKLRDYLNAKSTHLGPQNFQTPADPGHPAWPSPSPAPFLSSTQPSPSMVPFSGYQQQYVPSGGDLYDQRNSMPRVVVPELRPPPMRLPPPPPGNTPALFSSSQSARPLNYTPASVQQADGQTFGPSLPQVSGQSHGAGQFGTSQNAQAPQSSYIQGRGMYNQNQGWEQAHASQPQQLPPQNNFLPSREPLNSNISQCQQPFAQQPQNVNYMVNGMPWNSQSSVVGPGSQYSWNQEISSLSGQNGNWSQKFSASMPGTGSFPMQNVPSLPLQTAQGNAQAGYQQHHQQQQQPQQQQQTQQQHQSRFEVPEMLDFYQNATTGYLRPTNLASQPAPNLRSPVPQSGWNQQTMLVPNSVIPTATGQYAPSAEQFRSPNSMASAEIRNNDGVTASRPSPDHQPKAASTPLDDEPDSLPTTPVLTPRRTTLSQLSTDDMLSTIPGVPLQDILQPQILSLEDIKLMKAQQDNLAEKNPFDDQDKLTKFQKLFSAFDVTATRLLENPDDLEHLWKDLQDQQERDCKNHPIGVARCYPKKNRDPRIMPYDSTRVVMQSSKDDYINASYVEGITEYSPRLITTQTPLQNTVSDFWTMVIEQGVEVIGCVMTEYEAKEHCYWPINRQTPLTFGPVSVTLQKDSTEGLQSWTTKILTVSHAVTKVTRNVVHLRFIGWPVDGIPNTPYGFANFINEICVFQRKQRVLTKPIVIHCNLGAGPTGVLCASLICKFVMDKVAGVPEITGIVSNLRNRRKFLIDHRNQLRFLYSVILTFGRRILRDYGLYPGYTEKAKEPTAQPALVEKSRKGSLPIPDVLSDIRQELQRIGRSSPVDVAQQKILETKPVDLGGMSTVVSDDRKEKAGFLNQLPATFAGLAPSAFSLDLENSKQEKKKRITKDSFNKPSGNGTTKLADDLDNKFADLDPFWNMKDKNSHN